MAAALRISLLLALTLLPVLSSGQSLERQTCTRGNSATIQPNATAWLGGILSLNTIGSGGYGCGEPTNSMQAYEAIRWVLDLLNKKDEYLQTDLLTDYYVPGIRLGMMVRNYCDSERKAVASIADIYPQLKGDDGACVEQTTAFTIGLVGASTSDDSMAVSEATVDYNIPLISYESTATELTMPGKYTNFMRTISPDGPLMDVIVEVLTKLKWEYVAIVYDSGSYGTQGYKEVHQRMLARNICLTAAIMVDADDEASVSNTLSSVVSSKATGVIYIGPDNYARALVRGGNDQLAEAGALQWLFVDFPLSTTFESSSVYQRGIISVTAASRFIVEFEDHWIRIDENNPSPENPWFQSWYEGQNFCKFNPTGGEMNCNALYGSLSQTDKELRKRAEFQQDQYVEAAVMSVYTYARALRNAQMTECGSTSGACQALQDLSREDFMNKYLKKVNFTFTADERVPSLASKNVPPYNAAKHLKFTNEGDIVDPSYYVWNYNDIETGGGAKTFRFRRVGSYINGYLDMNLENVGMYSTNRSLLLRPLPPSLCPNNECMPCLSLPADIKYYFQQGDVVINGIFSLHNMGLTELTCGSLMSTNQIMFMQAMIYGIRQVNNDNSILNNIMLGGLGIDDCSSTSLGQAFLAQVQRGNLRIMDTAGSQLDPRTIEAYTAAHTSPLTLPLAEAMNMLMKPMVGYRAGSTELDNRMKYPYYLRAVPGIRDEIQAIVLLLKKLNWMFVQVVTSDKHYSQNAEETFRELGAKAGICIVASHNIGTTSQHANSVLQGLDANRATPPTVALLEMEDARRLLVALNSSLIVRSNIALIGTSRWGTRQNVIRNVETVAEGAITFSHRMSTLESFENYLKTLDVNTYMLNPWFRDWYMAAHGCSLSSQGGDTSLCDTSKPITDGPNYMLMYEVENVINAIKAIGQGLHRTLQFYCGNNYNSVCASFLNSQDKGMKFLEEIRASTFPIEDAPGMTFRFSGYTPQIPFEIYNIRSNSYQQVGQVMPWITKLDLNTDTSNTGNQIRLYSSALTSSIKPSCPTPCLACFYMFQYINYWYIPGDVVIGSIFDVHYKGNGPFGCGAVRDVNGALYTEVFNFAIQRINSGSASVRLNNNVTLGGLAFDGCTNPPRGTAIVNAVHTGMDIRDPNGENPMMTSQLVSWMAYDSQTTIDTATLLQKFNMPIVSPAATSSQLDDKSEFYTFFRTIPSESVIIKAMANFVNEIGKRYVIVLNAPDEANRASRDQFREILQGLGICVVASYEFVTDGSMDVIANSINTIDSIEVVAVFSEPDQYIADFLAAKQQYAGQLVFVANRPWGQDTRTYINQFTNSVFFDMRRPKIADFETYLRSRQVNTNINPWYREIYESFLNCKLDGTALPTCATTGNIPVNSDWVEDIRTLSTINAVYAITEAVHRTLKEKCGTAYTAVCPSFWYDDDVHARIMMHMDAENFTDIASIFFEFIERESNRNYNLMRYKSDFSVEEKGVVDRMGEITFQGRDQLVADYTSYQSVCPGDCIVCSISNANLQDFTLINGDIYIVGLFDVHKKGSTPFTCGEINDKHGLQLLEAFNYAIEYVNNKTGIFKDKLQGIQLGGVGLDMCKSPSRAASLVANIHSGNVNLVKFGNSVNPRRIDAYIATMDTESSTRVADILTQIQIPQISYGATGMDLLNREKYSYFLRSVPADDKQGRAMISYLKKFQFNNIQVVTSFDEVGEPGYIEFKRLALINKICIKIDYLIGEGGYTDMVNDAKSTVQDIRARTDAQVVVLWMKDPLPILEQASAQGLDVLFIATDKWGADPDFLKNQALWSLLRKRNLVILDVETADIPGYDRYLEYKTPDNYQSNPWFKDYFEMLQNCYWDTPSATRKEECDPSSTIPRADNYVQDPYVLYVINAVFSAALGIDHAVKNLCNNQYGVCNLYFNSGEKRQRVMSGLLQVNFTDDTHQPFFYTEDGQSDRGFHIYNVTAPTMASNDFKYENVGSYNDTHFLKLDITYTSSYVAQCDVDGSNPGLPNCTCEFPPDLPSRYMKRPDGKRGLTLVYIGDIHQPDPNNKLGCGPINTGVDLQKLLAFFYAIEKINANVDKTLPDSIRFDGLALDSCTHGLRLGQDVYNLLSGNQFCDTDQNGLVVSPSSITAFVIDKDSNALKVGSMLSQQKITSISPTAGHTLLNDQYNFPYFLRTRGDYAEMADVMLQVGRNAGWDFLSVIYTDNMANKGAADALMTRSAATSACVGDAVGLPMNATLDDAELALERISRQVGARAVVLYVEPAHMKLLMEASQNLGLTGRFVWVTPNDFTDDPQEIGGFEQEAAGALMVQVRSAILEDFRKYVMSLNYTNRREIPDDWFQEIYETLHQCNILNLENPTSTRYSRICSGDEVITKDMVTADPSVLHVIISVYAVATGLNKIPECRNTQIDISACLQLQNDRNLLIYNGILGTNFEVLPELLGDESFPMSFDTSTGNGQAGYLIKNYQASSQEDNTNPYMTRQLGSYSSSQGLDVDLNYYAGGNLFTIGQVPSSNCALGTTCQCVLPGGRTWDYTPTGLLDESTVRVGGTYRDPLTGEPVNVKSIPNAGDRFNDTWAIIITILAIIGVCISLAIFMYLLIMYPVRGGTSILGFIISFGIVLLYLMVFPFIAHADERICGLRRFGLGFVYAIVYSALMVKLVDCWRVRKKDDSYNAKYSKLGRPVGLFMVTLFLVLVQVMINAEWLILRIPKMYRRFYMDEYWPLCTPDNFYDEGLVLSLVYIMAMIFFSLVLGILTFRTTKNHRESRWILGILFLSVPCWVIWCTVSILGAIKVRDAAVAIGLLVNATIMLLLVPVRKLYLLHKYNVLIEEEEEEIVASQRGYDNSVYGRQYDNDPRLHDAGSAHGGSHVSSARGYPSPAYSNVVPAESNVAY